VIPAFVLYIWCCAPHPVLGFPTRLYAVGCGGRIHYRGVVGQVVESERDDKATMASRLGMAAFYASLASRRFQMPCFFMSFLETPASLPFWAAARRPKCVFAALFETPH